MVISSRYFLFKGLVSDFELKPFPTEGILGIRQRFFISAHSRDTVVPHYWPSQFWVSPWGVTVVWILLWERGVDAPGRLGRRQWWPFLTDSLVRNKYLLIFICSRYALVTFCFAYSRLYAALFDDTFLQRPLSSYLRLHSSASCIISTCDNEASHKAVFNTFSLLVMIFLYKNYFGDFPGGTVVKDPPANAGDTGSTLVHEDPTCRGATKPVCHNYWACTLEPMSHNYWSPRVTTTEARVPRAHAPQQEKPSQWEARAPQWRVAPTHHN